LRIRIYSHVSEIFKKVFHVECDIVTRSFASDCEFFAKSIYSDFIKFLSLLSSYPIHSDCPSTLSDPVSPAGSISWARNFCNLRVWLLWSLRLFTRDAREHLCNLRLTQVESGHIFLFFIINVMYYYTVLDLWRNGDDTRWQVK